jgi:hypothetical protein
MVRKFKHKKTGIVVSNETPLYISQNKFFWDDLDETYSIPKEFVENSSDWEEITEDPKQVKLPLEENSMTHTEGGEKMVLSSGITTMRDNVLKRDVFWKAEKISPDTTLAGEKTTTRYFIKTEKEFIDEFGESWRKKNEVIFPVKMDYLLGHEITKEDYDNILKSNPSFMKDWLGDGRVWSIAPYMVKAVEEKIEIQAPQAGEKYPSITLEMESTESLEKRFKESPEYKAVFADQALSENHASRYFIKTEEEFIREFGEGWRSEVIGYFNNKMDYLLGLEITKKDYEIIQNKASFYKQWLHEHNTIESDSYWTLTKDMVKEVQYAPTQSCTAEIPQPDTVGRGKIESIYPSIKGAILHCMIISEKPAPGADKYSSFMELIDEDHDMTYALDWTHRMIKRVEDTGSRSVCVNKFSIIR